MRDLVWQGNLALRWLRRGEWAVVDADTAGWPVAHWVGTMRACQVLGVSPLLSVALRGEPGSASSARFGRHLRHCHALNGRRVARLIERQEAVFAAAQTVGVELYPLKFAATRARLADPSLRPFADLDVFAPDADRAAVDRMAQLAGYQWQSRSPRHDCYMELGQAPPTGWIGEHPDLPIPLEVHHRAGVAQRGLERLEVSAAFRGEGAVDRHLLLYGLADIGADLLVGRARVAKLLDAEAVAAGFGGDDWQALLSLIIDHGVPRYAFAALCFAASTGRLVPPAWLTERLSAAAPASLSARLARDDWARLTSCRPGPLPPAERLAWCRDSAEQSQMAASWLRDYAYLYWPPSRARLASLTRRWRRPERRNEERSWASV